DDRLDLLRSELEEGRDAADRGVVDEEADRAIGDVGSEQVEKIRAREVKGDLPHGDAVHCLDLVRRRAEEIAVAVDQHEVQPASRELACPLRTKPGGGAGDERAGSIPVAERCGHKGVTYRTAGGASKHPTAAGRPPFRRAENSRLAEALSDAL